MLVLPVAFCTPTQKRECDLNIEGDEGANVNVCYNIEGDDGGKCDCVLHHL